MRHHLTMTVLAGAALSVPLAIPLSIPRHAMADVSAVWQMRGGEQMRVQYLDDENFRIIIGDVEQIMKDDRLYMVNRTGGDVFVQDMDALAEQMREMMGAMPGGPETPPPPNSPGMTPTDLTNTGDTEIVAGITGEVWHVVMENGQLMEMVVSDEPAVAEAGRAMQVMSQRMAAMAPPGMAGPPPADPNEWLGDRGAVLRVGDDLRLQSIEDAEIDPIVLELPGPVETMQMPPFGMAPPPGMGAPPGMPPGGMPPGGMPPGMGAPGQAPPPGWAPGMPPMPGDLPEVMEP